jgi:Tol biopolymer transport system component
MRRFVLFISLLWLLLLPVYAQDGLNLPSELYVLLNEGVVQRFGLGREGVSRVTPDNEFVLDFRVAPDANWLAYRTQAGLFISNLFEIETIRQIENDRASLPTIRGRGETMAWSANSDALAYTSNYGGQVHFFNENTFADLITPNLQHLLWSPNGMFLAAADNQSVWWVFQRNGTSMNLRAAIPGANGGDWRNGTQFIYAPIEGGVTILDLSAGNLQIQILNSTDTYYLPQALPDGSAVIFRGEPTAARLQQLIFEGDTAIASEIASGDVDLTGVSWSPGGFLLMAFQSGVLAQIDPITGNVFPLPITSASAYSWGPAYPRYAVNKTLPGAAYFIAPDLGGIQQVWVLPSDGSRARTVTPARLDISEFALSYDRQKLAYVSNSALWFYELGSDSAQELLTLGINQNITPAWGPDNANIYYRDEQGSEIGIWRMNLAGETQLFLADEGDLIYTNPNPAGGVAAMLVMRGDELALVDTTSGTINSLGIVGGGRWQSGTELIVRGFSRNEIASGNGLYALDANSTDQTPQLIVPLLGNLELLDYRIMSDGKIRILVRNRQPGEILVMDIGRDGNQATPIASVGYLVNPGLSADGTTIIGQRTPNGTLLVADIATGEMYRFDIQPPITGFVWR